MSLYPGIPAPKVTPHLSHEASRQIYGPDTTFQITRVDMVTNVGTYADAPLHRYPDGTDLADLPLARVADLPGLVVDARRRMGRDIGPWFFADVDPQGAAVLVRADWDLTWGTPDYLKPGPYLTREASELLVARGVALVGVDFWNIDNIDDLTRPSHTVLLKAGVVIVEHLCNLRALPASGFRFHAAPAPVRGCGSFPVRAYAVVPD